jgi:multidrug efflux pump subunit AcrA (membrane-fusion protein)
LDTLNPCQCAGKSLVWKLLALPLIVLVLAGCTLLPASKPSSVAQEEVTPTPVPTPIVPNKPTYVVGRGEVVKQLQMSGRIAPVEQQDLFFKVNGRVRSIFIKQKDMVKKGQILADLEISDQERELAGGKLDLERAQVRLKQAESQLQDETKGAQANLAIAQENLASVRGQDPAPRKIQAEVALKKAELNVQQAQANYDAIAWRNDKGASQEGAVLQQATLEYQDAKATYDLAMQAISNYGHQINVAQQQVQLAQIALNALARGVDPLLQNDVQRAELNVQKLEATVQNAQLIAPFDGQVLSSSLIEGKEVTGYSPLVTVADPAKLEVVIEPSGVNISDLAVKMAATIVFVGRPGVDIAGEVRRLPDSAFSTKVAEQDQDKTLRVAITKAPADMKFEVGDLARVTVVLEKKSDVLWLPPAAVRTFEGRKFVVIQEKAGQRRVDVKVGVENDDRVEIQDGVTEGQTVVGQ